MGSLNVIFTIRACILNLFLEMQSKQQDFYMQWFLSKKLLQISFSDLRSKTEVLLMVAKSLDLPWSNGQVACRSPGFKITGWLQGSPFCLVEVVLQLWNSWALTIKTGHKVFCFFSFIHLLFNFLVFNWITR